jgi:acyl-CoA reductase-like NAD-dependent aldehyde dehydrogenase
MREEHTMGEMTRIEAHYQSPFKLRNDNFIGGRFVAPLSGRYFGNITPISGETVCEVARSDAADVELAGVWSRDANRCYRFTRCAAIRCCARRWRWR